MEEKKLTKKERKELKKLEEKEDWKKQQTSKFFKTIATWLGIAVFIVISVIGLIKVTENSSSPSNPTKVTIPPITKEDVTIGNPKAKFVLTEFSDLQCPACAAYHPLVNQILKDFDGKILFVYKFFPLTQAHKNAIPGSMAGYAAAQQAKFAEMSDLLFNNQKDWGTLDNPQEIFITYAQKIGLDIEKFKTDMNSDAGKKLIDKEQNQGITLGVNSTPTFFINNTQVSPNPTSYEAFKGLIEKELNK